MDSNTMIKKFIETLSESDLFWVFKALIYTHTITDTATIDQLAKMMNVNASTKCKLVKFEKFFRSQMIGKLYRFKYGDKDFYVCFENLPGTKLIPVTFIKIDD